MSTIPRIIRTVPIALLAALCWPGLAGCGYTAPTLTIIEGRATERTPDGVAMLFTVEAANENDEGLPLRTVDYTVDLDGKRVFQGTRSPEATIRRRGVQRFTLPAVVNLAEAPEFARHAGPNAYTVSGSVRYVTPGQLAEVLFDAGVHVPSVGFSGSGQVDLGAAHAVMPKPADDNPLKIDIVKSRAPGGAGGQ